jgi:hypothetical protein
MNREAMHVLDLVIKPVLKVTGMDNHNGMILTCYTGETETHYDALRQVLQSGNYGEAYGWWGMQENAYNQCVKYLNRTDNQNLKKSILAACYLDMMPPLETLIWNVRFACCMARVQYWQEEEPIPDDLEGMAHYYLKYYNRGGKGNVQKFMDDCKDLLPLEVTNIGKGT